MPYASVRGVRMAASVVIASMFCASTAHAWYFPEHVVISKDALRELPPEIRSVLGAAIARARGDGLPLCERADVGLEDVARTKPLTTHMLLAERGVDCIPYAALPALGGDHSDGADELRRVLTTQKGREITTAAAYQWERFARASEALPNTPLERMSFVHELDVDFYYIDPGYEVRASSSRSHFVDAGRSIGEVARNAARAGAVDNAFGQFLTHHLRSLQLAARGGTGSPFASEALIEHGLALHFLQDAFSAGHLVMNDYYWARGNTHARHRHDFFDAKGLSVRRALGAEPCTWLGQSVESNGGLSPCWTTTGDGYLGLTADGADRRHAARAVKKTEIALAMAFDPSNVVHFVESLGEREQVAIGDLLDPMPWWTLPASARRRRATTSRHALALVRGAAAAVEKLRAAPLMHGVIVGEPSRGALFDEQWVADAIAPCSQVETGIDRDADGDESDGCAADRSLALGAVGVSFVRPMIVELPAAEDDISKVEGQAMTDHGMAFQISVAAAAGALFPPRSPVDFFAPSMGASAGFSYRFGTYLPGRQNRSVVELNLGLVTALHASTRGRAGGNPTVTMLEQELRWPILWELLTSYVRPFDLRASRSAGSLILLGGIRVREMLTGPSPRLWGIELEALSIELSRGIGAYPLYGGSIDARFYVGLANPSIAQPGFESSWAPTVSLAVTSGYSTFL